jgi:adenosylcobinamide-phosphate synthase
LATVITLSGPLMVLILALIVGATLGEYPPAIHPAVWMDKLTAALRRLLPARRAYAGTLALLVPSLFAGAALLLGWVNAPDLVVVILSVWLLAGCLSVPASERAGAESPLDHLTGRFVAPLFYYALLGLPGAVFYRAVHGAGALAAPMSWLDRGLTALPRRVTALVLRLAGALRGQDTREWITRQGEGALTPLQMAETWRTVKLAAWIAAAVAALTLYPRHAFLV